MRRKEPNWTLKTKQIFGEDTVVQLSQWAVINFGRSMVMMMTMTMIDVG